MRKILFIIVMCFALGSSAFAQLAVTGVVTGEDGIGIPGVTVLQKGTGNGTITDLDGKYTLKLPPDAVIVFSFVGMKAKEIAVNGSSTINVQLETDAVGISEVVVTALGIERESKQIGYAMTKIDGAELATLNTVNPVQALQGKAPGLSIGISDGGLFGNSKIQLRGVSVLNSNNNQPIFVIDGVILENPISNTSADWVASASDWGNQLKNLNPDDYESVNVLKGSAATALYGSRGINGAIVIKTKGGIVKKGIGVKVSQSTGIDHVYDEPYIQYEFGLGMPAGYIDYGKKR